MLPSSGWIAKTQNAPSLSVNLPIPHLATYRTGPGTGDEATTSHFTGVALISGGSRVVTVSVLKSDTGAFDATYTLSTGQVYGSLILDSVNATAAVILNFGTGTGFRAQILIPGFDAPLPDNATPSKKVVPPYQGRVWSGFFDFVNGELIVTPEHIDGLYWTVDPVDGLVIDLDRRGGKSLIVDLSLVGVIQLILP